MSNFPGVYQLLPDRQYDQAIGPPLRVESNDAYLPAGNYGYQRWSAHFGEYPGRSDPEHRGPNELLLSEAIRIHDYYETSLVPYDPNVAILRVVGENRETPTHFRVHERSWGDRFKAFSLQSTVTEVELELTGDGTVPFGSAIANSPAAIFDQIHAVPYSHVGMLRDDRSVVDFVVCYLNQSRVNAAGDYAGCGGGSSDPMSASPGSDAERVPQQTSAPAWNFEFSGPILGYVEDQFGNVVGLPGATIPPEALGRIPEAEMRTNSYSQTLSFWREGSYTGDFSVTTPIDGDVIEIRVETISDGQVTGQALFWLREPISTKISFAFTSSQTLSSLQLELDRDADGVVDETIVPDAIVTGPAVIDDATPSTVATVDPISSSEATITLAATDAGGAGVATTQYQVVGVDSELQTYTGPITVAEGSLVLFRSFDEAGNFETLQEVNVPGTGPTAVATSIDIDGSPVTLTMTEPGQVGEATFAGTAGQDISLLLSDVTVSGVACCGVKISVRNPDGSDLVAPAKAGTAGDLIEATLPSSGTYTIVVDPASDLTGSVTLTLYGVTNSADTIMLSGSPVTATVSTPGQESALTFDAVAGQYVTLDITDVAVGSQNCDAVSNPAEACGTRVQVLQPNGTVLASLNGIDQDDEFLDAIELPDTGTYTILVDPQHTNTGSLKVALRTVVTVSDSINIGGSTSLTLDTPGQNGLVSFNATAGQELGIDVTGVSIGTSDCCGSRISVLDPNGTPIGSVSTFGLVGGVVGMKIPEPGTYTILIDPERSNTGGVTLSLSEVVEISDAIAIDGTPLEITTVYPNQNVEVTFMGNAGQVVKLDAAGVTLGGSACCGAQMSILKPDDTTLISPVAIGTDGKSLDAFTLPVSGEYTIIIDPQSARAGGITLTLGDIDEGVDQYLSDLPWLSETNTWGPVERDMSNGEDLAGDGLPLSINGVSYTKGIGVHAASTIEVAIPATCSLFLADIGVDDEVSGTTASVRFEVWVDGVMEYQSATITDGEGPYPISVDVSGGSVLELVVDEVDTDAWDHADWADARFGCGADQYLSDLSWLSETNAWGPVERDMSNGEQAAGDGLPISINGVTYEKGIGMHAASSVELAIPTTCSLFLADIGVDDEVTGTTASVSFEVWVDGVQRYKSATIGADEGPYPISVDVSGGGILELVIDVVDTDAWDHADWADARFGCGGDQYVSDLSWLSETNAWGPVERDQSNGEQLAGDGLPISINGVSYDKGIGMHAASSVELAIPTSCSTFLADVGVDDEVAGTTASVRFDVWVDGVMEYQSATFTDGEGPYPVSVDVSGGSVLELVVDEVDTNAWDHADWADARFECDG